MVKIVLVGCGGRTGVFDALSVVGRGGLKRPHLCWLINGSNSPSADVASATSLRGSEGGVGAAGSGGVCVCVKGWLIWRACASKG
jgi:hypothetical protein